MTTPKLRAAPITFPALVHRHTRRRWFTPGDGSWTAVTSSTIMSRLTAAMPTDGWWTMTETGPTPDPQSDTITDHVTTVVHYWLDRADTKTGIPATVLADIDTTDQPDNWETEGVDVNPLPFEVIDTDSGALLGHVDGHMFAVFASTERDLEYRWLITDDGSVLAGYRKDRPLFILAPSPPPEPEPELSAADAMTDDELEAHLGTRDDYRVTAALIAVACATPFDQGDFLAVVERMHNYDPTFTAVFFPVVFGCLAAAKQLYGLLAVDDGEFDTIEEFNAHRGFEIEVEPIPPEERDPARHPTASQYPVASDVMCMFAAFANSDYRQCGVLLNDLLEADTGTETEGSIRADLLMCIVKFLRQLWVTADHRDLIPITDTEGDSP